MTTPYPRKRKASESESESEIQRQRQYIGYSMRKKRWVSIRHEDKRSDTYEFFNSGATAFTYVNAASNKLVKIIHGSRYGSDDNYAAFIKECEKEIEYQQRAARNGLGPRIYDGKYGFVEQKNSFYDTPYFYIVMEYLSEKNGWKHIFAGDIRDSIFCNYIKDLVSKTGLINDEDPQAHFYYNNKKNKLYMIDYGRCKECKNLDVSESECIELMSSALDINCDEDRMTMRTGGKRNVVKYNSGGTKTHKRIRKTTKKLRKCKTHKKRKTRRGRK